MHIFSHEGLSAKGGSPVLAALWKSGEVQCVELCGESRSPQFVTLVSVGWGPSVYIDPSLEAMSWRRTCGGTVGFCDRTIAVLLSTEILQVFPASFQLQVRVAVGKYHTAVNTALIDLTH